MRSHVYVWIPALLVATSALARPAAPALEAWQTLDELPQVDLTGLSPEARARALGFMREAPCTCTCSMRVAECRVKDPTCPALPEITRAVVETVRRGEDLGPLAHVLDSWLWPSPRAWSRAPALGDPIAIPLAAAPRLGPVEAPVTLVVFTSFLCEPCADAARWYRWLPIDVRDSLQVVVKLDPVAHIPAATLAAHAAMAAAEQGRFWDFHDRMFAEPLRVSRDQVLAWADEFGLDRGRFIADLDSERVRLRVAADAADACRAGLDELPALFLNGRRYFGPLQFPTMRPYIADALRAQE